MITKPMDILTQFPVRKSKAQKQAFRRGVEQYCDGLGYRVTVEKSGRGIHNLVIGDPEKAKFLVTAHYDTCAHMPFPNFITPCNPVVYLLYQLLIVGGLLVISFAAAFGVMYAADSPELGLAAWYLVYFGVLALMMVGPANKTNANDNTSGVVTLLEILTTIPRCHRNKVCFVLFDLEEAGLLGSAAYRKSHKTATDTQIVLNLDCVGDGDRIMLFPNKKLRLNTDGMEALGKICGVFGDKRINLHRKGFAMCPSDHKHFPLGVGIMAFHYKKGIGLYCDRIHTNRDTVLELTNVNILRAAITTLICQ